MWGDSKLRPLVSAKYVGLNMPSSTLECAEVEVERYDEPDTTFVIDDADITTEGEGGETPTETPPAATPPAAEPIEPGQEM